MPETEKNKAVENTQKTDHDSDNVDKKLTPIGNFPSIEEFTKNGFSDVMQATKLVNSLPQGAARDLYCAYPVFGKIIDKQCERILGIVSKVLKTQNVKGNIQRRQPDEQFEMLLECNDTMMEELSVNLDELAGIKKVLPPQSLVEASTDYIKPNGTQSPTIVTNNVVGAGAGSWNIRHNKPANSIKARLITAKNIVRPQTKFKIPVDNRSSAPFEPKLKYKPNSLKPLAILPLYDETGNIESYLHPYEFELMRFEVQADQLERKNPKIPAAMATTPYLFVDTVPKLERALAELRTHKQLAVDVEHHSYRSFQGFTCLLQISSPEKDYLFDALELRDDLHMLNEVFTDAKIVKIFHGADSDVEWLQRDLSIYIVNMFDTHQAAKALNLARLSLAFLLKHYCNIDADKTLQLADWRIRPLPEELVIYARQDTHNLIYIYERICNDLLDVNNQQTNLIRAVYQRSKELCMKRYQKPVLHSDSHLDFYRKSKRLFDNRQLFALHEIYHWRDKMARLEDESYGYVLPNHMLLQIAENLPREMQSILACCKPVPPLVRQHLHELHQIILRSREQPLVKPVLETVELNRIVNNDINKKIQYPHAVSQNEEFRDDLPTLLNFGKVQFSSILGTEQDSDEENITDTKINMIKPSLPFFESDHETEESEPEEELDADDSENVQSNKSLLLFSQFISPYQRYLAMLPFVEKEKREEAARLQAENLKRKLCPEADTVPIVANCNDEDNNKSTLQATDDILGGLPIKQFLKRKYEESVAAKAEIKAKKPKIENEVSPTAKNDTSALIISDDDEPPQEKPSTSSKYANQKKVNELKQQTQEMPHLAQAEKPNKHSKKAKLLQSKKQVQKQVKSHQSSDKPVQVNFDYKNVDFKRFQGGAQRAKGTHIKHKFQGKGGGNKATNKKFNKLFNFSNVKNKK